MRQSLIICCFFLTITTYAQHAGNQYADVIIDAHFEPRHSRADGFQGGIGNIFPMAITPDVVLGNTNYFLSLTKGSYIIVGFTDNEIIDYPGKDDIFITELGCSKEHADVYVSSDNTTYTYLGEVDDCHVSSLDLATIGYKNPVRYIKIVGKDSRGASPGYDIKNIMGLPNSNRTVEVPEEPIVEIIDVEVKIEKDSIVKKAFILENVTFESNSSDLQITSYASLNQLANHLKTNTHLNIKISGHTDNVGDDDDNLQLSKDRAKAVMDFLILQGIASSRLSSDGFGETIPVQTNDTKEGRKANRRVEFEVVD